MNSTEKFEERVEAVFKDHGKSVTDQRTLVAYILGKSSRAISPARIIQHIGASAGVTIHESTATRGLEDMRSLGLVYKLRGGFIARRKTGPIGETIIIRDPEAKKDVDIEPSEPIATLITALCSAHGYSLQSFHLEIVATAKVAAQ